MKIKLLIIALGFLLLLLPIGIKKVSAQVSCTPTVIDSCIRKDCDGALGQLVCIEQWTDAGCTLFEKPGSPTNEVCGTTTTPDQGSTQKIITGDSAQGVGSDADSWCTGRTGVFICTDADMNHGVGLCKKDEKTTCTQYNFYECTTSKGVNYCSQPQTSCAEPCSTGMNCAPTSVNPSGLNGQTNYVCTGNVCPSASDQGVGVPWRCENGEWKPQNSNGECTNQCKPSGTSCSKPAGYAGEWRYDCNLAGGVTCPDNKNQGVGVPFRCEGGIWANKNPKGECTNKCPSTSIGQCTVTNWTFSSSNPPPNTLIKATVKGAGSSSWSNIVYKKDSEGWVTSKVDVTDVPDGPTFSFDVNSGKAGPHTVTLGINSGTGICAPPGSFTTGGSSINVDSFRVTEDPTDWSSAPRPYNGPVKVPWSFKDKKPGTKTIFVQFYDKNDKQVGERRQASIDLLGGDPVISGCSLSFEGQNVTYEINGTNFGSDKGGVTSDSTPLDIKSWSPTKIKASFTNPPTGQSFPITVTNSSGQEANGLCSAVSQLSLGAKVFCRAPSSHDTDNVDLALKEATAGGKTVKQKVKIDKDGVIRDLNKNLENGKAYKLSLKALKSLRKTITFTAGDGATNIPDFVLPVGDIFPLDSGDGTINNFDKSELNRQWIISQDATGRSGDFNQDERVNAVDWSCMRHDFGKSDDPEP